MTSLPSPSPDLDPDLAAAAEYALAAKAANTRRGYEADWRHFGAWCADRDQAPMPAAPALIAAYLAAHAVGSGGVRKLKTATLQRRLAAIAAFHRAAGHADPTKGEEVRATWRGIRRDLGWRQAEAAPAVTDVLRRLVATCDGDRYIGLRDRAMLLLGFTAMLRRSEIVALDVEDLALVEHGLEVRIDRSATDRDDREAVRAVPYGRNPDTCPVRAWLAWRDAAGLVDGPAFRPVHPRLRLPDGGGAGVAASARPGAADPRATIQAAPRLTDVAVYRAVQTAARRAGLDHPERYSGHSLRAGAAVQAAPVASDVELMAAGGWRSAEVLRRYTRRSRIWEDPVAGRLGL